MQVVFSLIGCYFHATLAGRRGDHWVFPGSKTSFLAMSVHRPVLKSDGRHGGRDGTLHAVVWSARSRSMARPRWCNRLLVPSEGRTRNIESGHASVTDGVRDPIGSNHTGCYMGPSWTLLLTSTRQIRKLSAEDVRHLN